MLVAFPFVQLHDKKEEDGFGFLNMHFTMQRQI
jgi:hypothetical protein